jgi:hypothetical protein
MQNGFGGGSLQQRGEASLLLDASNIKPSSFATNVLDLPPSFVIDHQQEINCCARLSSHRTRHGRSIQNPTFAHNLYDEWKHICS